MRTAIWPARQRGGHMIHGTNEHKYALNMRVSLAPMAALDRSPNVLVVRAGPFKF
jgi:hypothetical protein